MNKATYGGDVAGRGQSWSIWGNCPSNEIMEDHSVGRFIDDDFLGFNGLVTTNVGKYTGGWQSYETTGASIVPLADATHGRNGLIRIGCTGADNYLAQMVSQGNVGTCARIDTSANGGTKLWLETRVRPLAITGGSWFFGFHTTAAGNGEIITASEAMYTTAVNFVGFWNTVGAALQAVYATGAAVTVNTATAKTMVAGTWYKLGMSYDPDIGFKWFVDGVQVGTTVAASATNFPDALDLAIAYAITTSVGLTTVALDADWVKLVQLI